MILRKFNRIASLLGLSICYTITICKYSLGDYISLLKEYSDILLEEYILEEYSDDGTFHFDSIQNIEDYDFYLSQLEMMNSTLTIGDTNWDNQINLANNVFIICKNMNHDGNIDTVDTLFVRKKILGILD